MSRCDFTQASLNTVHAVGTDFSKSNFSRPNFMDANLREAKFSDIKGLYFQIPQNCALVGWGKKSGKLVKLLIPSAAKRTACLINRKCRAEYAKVLLIANGTVDKVEVNNEYGKTVYRVGSRVNPHKYCDDFRIDCAPGIHFFITREEAEQWLG